jgi:hypothetical protein
MREGFPFRQCLVNGQPIPVSLVVHPNLASTNILASGSDLDEFNYFVHPPHPGSHPNAYIYFIDRGVQLGVKSVDFFRLFNCHSN